MHSFREPCAGSTDIYSKLDALHAETDRGFDTVISGIQSEGPVRTARELKDKVDSLIQAHEPLVADIINLAADGSRGMSDYAKEDADKAEARADYLYSWANNYLPETAKLAAQVALSKHVELKTMPYIVCMAYAVRVKLDAHLVRSKDDCAYYYREAADAVEKFVGVVSPALKAVTGDTSLLSIAFVRHYPIAIYATLVRTLRDSARNMGSPKAASKQIERWDDGLSGIR